MIYDLTVSAFDPRAQGSGGMMPSTILTSSFKGYAIICGTNTRITVSAFNYEYPTQTTQLYRATIGNGNTPSVVDFTNDTLSERKQFSIGYKVIRY